MMRGHTAKSLGHRSTPEYRAYYMQRDSCLNPRSKNARWYYDRGIEFLFSSFAEFLAHIGLRPADDYCLMRIDRNGNVSPGNLPWVKVRRCKRRKRR